MESIGQRFKAAREKKRISLSQAALKIHTKVQILEALERDDYTRMPAPTYAKGFIRLYASYLGLEAAPLVQEYMERHGGGAKRPPLPADVALAKPAPGDIPADIPSEPAAIPASSAPSSSKGPSVTFTPQALAIALAIVAVLLIIVGAVKFLPASNSATPAENTSTKVVEVQRPVQRSPLAVMREPADPYLPVAAGTGRAP